MQSSILKFLSRDGENAEPEPEAHDKEAYTTCTRNSNRAVKSAWFNDFSWLLINEDGSEMKCSVCIRAGKQNVFTRGKSALIRPKKDDLVKHQASVDHRSAAESQKLAQTMKRAAANAYGNIKDAVIAQMVTCLVQAQRDIPTCKNEYLIDMQIFNSVTCLKHLRPSVDEAGGQQSHYMHSDSINDIYTALKAVTEEEIQSEENESPYSSYGICVDEATDSSNKSVALIYKRYVTAAGKLITRFLSVRELQSTCAEDIYLAICEVLDEKNCSKSNMVGMATDGAGNMIGIRKGVTTRFKQEIEHLISNHCMAHRLQLASEKAANQVRYVVKYISVLIQFARSLKFSPKLCRMLETAKDLEGVKGTKIKQVFFTRWLSFQDSVQALVGCLSPVIESLYEAAADRGLESRAILMGVVKQMATYSFILMTHFLADTIGILGTLSKIMQREH